MSNNVTSKIGEILGRLGGSGSSIGGSSSGTVLVRLLQTIFGFVGSVYELLRTTFTP